MPPPFQRLTVQQFAEVLQAFRFTRRITSVHMHHTWRPDHSMWRGQVSVEGMWRSHTQERGFSDIAQHLTIDPQGNVWTGRNWNQAPASAVGHNGNGVAGPFMFETVGNFDKGCDPFDGAQRQAVLDVIALVQRRFGLDAETLLFHNQVATKTCPGTSIDRGALVAELRAHVPNTDAAAPAALGARGKRGMPLPPSAFADAAAVQRAIQLIERGAASRGSDPLATPLEELDYSHDTLAREGSRGLFGGLAGGSRLGPADIDALRPYVVNLRQGQFSSEGLMTTNEADVDMILFEHAAKAANEAVANGRPFKLLLYAHGGLVKESAGLATAQSHVGWWRDNGVYPIHFVWETGFFETVRDILTRSRDAAGGARGVISDFITDPLLELGARALQAPRIWGSMKSSAFLASQQGGGVQFFLERLLEFCKQFNKQHGGKNGRIELHAAGHSAGSIFIGHLLQLAAAAKTLPSFSTVQFMAPAIRADAFKQLVQPLVGKSIEALTIYTMRRDFERADNCAKIYRKSLLYLVSAACEPEVGAPILGLEDSLRRDAGLRALFGLGTTQAGSAEVVWSRSAASEGRNATQAVHHGDFDNDAPTMESLGRRVLGIDDATELARRFPTGGARGTGDPWEDGVDWPPEFPLGGGSAMVATSTAPPAPMESPALTPAAVTAIDDEGLPRGRRLALCVGIDTYPTAPLSGCVNDAKLWQRILEGLGFEVKTLFNEEARRDSLAAAIQQHFSQARAGDEIVLQFAGHGTQAPDLDGDEAGGDTPGLDEALCPHDFDAGPLLLDDDLGAMIDRVARGVRLTLFMDCCHSGNNSRAAPTPGAKPRSVKLTPEQKQAFIDWRSRQPVSRTVGAKRSASDPMEVNFGACQSRELEWESNGQGEFTVHATKLLQSGGASLTPDAFYRSVIDAFGTSRRQTPNMEAPPERLAKRLFRG